MTIITETATEKCKRMSIKEFKEKCLRFVRVAEYMELVDSWEKHVIYNEFKSYNSCSHGLSSYQGNIYFVDSLNYQKTPPIGMYLFSYNEIYREDHSASFRCKHGTLYEESILAISKFFTCFSKNKNHYIECILESYHTERNERELPGTARS
jgi:hypothetical protein